MGQWLLEQGEILPVIIVMVGIALILFCFIWFFLEYLLISQKTLDSDQKPNQSSDWLHSWCNKQSND